MNSVAGSTQVEERFRAIGCFISRSYTCVHILKECYTYS